MNTNCGCVAKISSGLVVFVLAVLPFTRMPVTNLWEIVCWMAQRQRQRFAEQYG